MTENLKSLSTPNYEYIAEMIKSLNIKAIYYIDDDILPDVSGFVNLIIDNKGELQSGILKRFSISELLPLNVVKTNLAEAIDKLESSEVADLISQTLNELNYDLQFLRVHSTLKNFTLINGIDFSPLPPHKWEEVSHEIFDGLNDGERVLCLFDQDLSKAGGKYSRTGSGSGIGLLEEAANRLKMVDKSIFCILSTTFTIDNEEDQWIALSKSEGASLDLTQFFPLSKQRLDNIEAFENGLKNALLNSRCHVLKKKSHDVLTLAFQDSIEEFSHIRLNDFIHMIFRSSKEEGALEADTMLRIQALLQQQKLKTRMVTSDPDYASVINRNVELANKILALNPKTTTLPSNSSIDIRTLELYDEGIIINGLFSPTELGDIYERQSGRKKYIVVGQPCDLAVRKDGTRINTNSVILLEIEEKEAEEFERLEKRFGKTLFKLNYFFNASFNSSKIAYVKLNKQNIIKIDVLDLCALNSQGAAIITFNQDNPCPEQLHTAWRKRFYILNSEFNKIKDSYDLATVSISDLTSSLRNIVQNLLLPSMSFTDFKFNKPYYKNGIFDFGIKRIRRLRKAEATKLLNAFTRYMSRDADDHDFARALNE